MKPFLCCVVLACLLSPLASQEGPEEARKYADSFLSKLSHFDPAMRQEAAEGKTPGGTRDKPRKTSRQTLLRGSFLPTRFGEEPKKEQPRTATAATAAVKEESALLLAQSQALDKTLEAIQANGDDERVQAVLGELRSYFLHDLLKHLKDEDEEFLPAVARLPQGGEKAARLEQDHRELRRRVEEFRAGLTLEEYVGRETRRALLWRLVTDGRAILASLRIHAAFEYELVREMNGLTEAGSTPSVDFPALRRRNE